jgi:hypothetical protein
MLILRANPIHILSIEWIVEEVFKKRQCGGRILYYKKNIEKIDFLCCLFLVFGCTQWSLTS